MTDGKANHPRHVEPDPAAAPDGERRVIDLTPAGQTETLPPTPPTFYEKIGGERTFRELVGHFYRGVAEDPVLRPLYPEADLGPAEERLRLFLEQYWGGPRTYSEHRGHPRLRMRHIPFTIGPAERDAWLARMSAAIDAVGITGEDRDTLWRYLTMAAGTLVNAPGPDQSEVKRSEVKRSGGNRSEGDRSDRTEAGPEATG